MDTVDKFFEKPEYWKIRYGQTAKANFFFSAWTVGLLRMMLGFFFSRFQHHEFDPPFVGWIAGHLKGNLRNTSTLLDRPMHVDGDIFNEGLISHVVSARRVYNFGEVTEICGKVPEVLQWGSSETITTEGDVLIFPEGSAKKVSCKNLFVWGWNPDKGNLEFEVTGFVFLMDCVGNTLNGVYGGLPYIYGKGKFNGKLMNREDADAAAKAAKAAAAKAIPLPPATPVPAPAPVAAPAAAPKKTPRKKAPAKKPAAKKPAKATAPAPPATGTAASGPPKSGPALTLRPHALVPKGRQAT